MTHHLEWTQTSYDDRMTETPLRAVRTDPKNAPPHLVPGWMRVSLFSLLLTAGALSVPRLGEYGPLPTTVLLDIWVVAFIFNAILTARLRHPFVLLLLSAFLIERALSAYFSESPWPDFFQAYRWVMYLIAFVLAIGRSWGPRTSLVRVVWALLTMALAKAVLTFVFEGPGERPGLLLENNFELALFAGLLAVVYRDILTRRWLAVGMLIALAVLSGSRSGAVACAILAIYAVLQVPRTRENMLRRYLLLLLAPLLVLIPVLVFTSRAGPGRIDRLNFLDVFLAETAQWSALTWLVGTPPITPLSPSSCGQLSFYYQLFASTGDGTCYSVILHAFALRVVFDAGVLGLILAFGIAAFSMIKARVQVGLALTLLAIAFANSLSVSGLNNPYVALPILLAILTASRTGTDETATDHQTTTSRARSLRSTRSQSSHRKRIQSGIR